jgi:hypothetical protein
MEIYSAHQNVRVFLSLLAHVLLPRMLSEIQQRLSLIGCDNKEDSRVDNMPYFLSQKHTYVQRCLEYPSFSNMAGKEYSV